MPKKSSTKKKENSVVEETTVATVVAADTLTEYKTLTINDMTQTELTTIDSSAVVQSKIDELKNNIDKKFDEFLTSFEEKLNESKEAINNACHKDRANIAENSSRIEAIVKTNSEIFSRYRSELNNHKEAIKSLVIDTGSSIKELFTLTSELKDSIDKNEEEIALNYEAQGTVNDEIYRSIEHVSDSIKEMLNTALSDIDTNFDEIKLRMNSTENYISKLKTSIDELILVNKAEKIDKKVFEKKYNEFKDSVDKKFRQCDIDLDKTAESLDSRIADTNRSISLLEARYDNAIHDLETANEKNNLFKKYYSIITAVMGSLTIAALGLILYLITK